MSLNSIQIKTNSKNQFLNITSKINEVVHSSKIENGICCIFIPHTTAGVTINEAADPAVVSDILKELSKIVPTDDNYSHMEGNSAAHIKTTMVGSSLIVPILNGNLSLGTWQGIFFCEFDGPRNRSVNIQLLKE